MKYCIQKCNFFLTLQCIVCVGGFPIHQSYATCITNFLGTHAKCTNQHHHHYHQYHHHQHHHYQHHVPLTVSWPVQGPYFRLILQTFLQHQSVKKFPFSICKHFPSVSFYWERKRVTMFSSDQLLLQLFPPYHCVVEKFFINININYLYWKDFFHISVRSSLVRTKYIELSFL